mmetsp:Transcript_13404/g.15048  ORF Transcript_13404/g.15048 Transcript_13404/m.15048 type:complete len:161 (-) Transcript_13404:43-525(-)
MLDQESKRVIRKGRRIKTKQKNFDIELDHLNNKVRRKLIKLKVHNLKQLHKYKRHTRPREIRLTSITADGSKYIGEFSIKTNIKDGVGYLINSDGSIFEGAFENDVPKRGRYILTNGQVLNGLITESNISSILSKTSYKGIKEEESTITTNNTSGSDYDE